MARCAIASCCVRQGALGPPGGPCAATPSLRRARFLGTHLAHCAPCCSVQRAHRSMVSWGTGPSCSPARRPTAHGRNAPAWPPALPPDRPTDRCPNKPPPLALAGSPCLACNQSSCTQCSPGYGILSSGLVSVYYYYYDYFGANATAQVWRWPGRSLSRRPGSHPPAHPAHPCSPLLTPLHACVPAELLHMRVGLRCVPAWVPARCRNHPQHRAASGCVSCGRGACAGSCSGGSITLCCLSSFLDGSWAGRCHSDRGPAVGCWGTWRAHQ